MTKSRKKEDIGAMVRFHRNKAGLTLIQLARRAGVGKTVMFDIENNKHSIQSHILWKVFKALKIKVVYVSPLMKQYEKERK